MGGKFYISYKMKIKIDQKYYYSEKLYFLNISCKVHQLLVILLYYSLILQYTHYIYHILPPKHCFFLPNPYFYFPNIYFYTQTYF